MMPPNLRSNLAPHSTPITRAEQLSQDHAHSDGEPSDARRVLVEAA